jgi:hypothetical protein
VIEIGLPAEGRLCEACPELSCPSFVSFRFVFHFSSLRLGLGRVSTHSLAEFATTGAGRPF